MCKKHGYNIYKLEFCAILARRESENCKFFEILRKCTVLQFDKPNDFIV